MNKKPTLVLAAILLLFLCFNSNALAAWSFDISTDYAAGDAQAVFDLNFHTDETLSVNTYAIEFLYDNNELSYVGYTNTPFTGMWPDFPIPVTDDKTNGTLDGFVAFGTQPVSVAPGDYLLGTFTFDELTPVADGATDFNFDYPDRMFGIAISYIPYYGDPSWALTHFTDIAPVPVPAAVWLLGSGLAGLACFRRRKAA